MTEPGAPEPEHSVPPRQDPSPHTGLAPNAAGALCYLLGPITGVLFLVLEKRDPFVRFHAAQSIGISVAFIAFWIAYGIVSSVLTAIPVLGWLAAILLFIFSAVLGLAGLALWIFLMYKAWSGEEWEFPWIGERSRKLILGR